jgi:hypothetical protein
MIDVLDLQAKGDFGTRDLLGGQVTELSARHIVPRVHTYAQS